MAATGPAAGPVARWVPWLCRPGRKLPGRRLVLAAEARWLGHGGIELVTRTGRLNLGVLFMYTPLATAVQSVP